MESSEIFEKLRLELRRGALPLAVLAQLRQEHYGYSLRKQIGAMKTIARNGSTEFPLLAKKCWRYSSKSGATSTPASTAYWRRAENEFTEIIRTPGGVLSSR
jgi:hypothetical protein